MNNKEYTLKTTFDVGYELEDGALCGKKITRNIEGFNITMHFKKGICKIKVNNIAKLNNMTNIDQKYRNIDFERMCSDFEYKLKSIEKMEYLLDKIEKNIIGNYYDTNKEVTEYNSDDLNSCNQFYIEMKA